MSKKKLHILYGKLLHTMGHYFFDTQYEGPTIPKMADISHLGFHVKFYYDISHGGIHMLLLGNSGNAIPSY